VTNEALKPCPFCNGEVSLSMSKFGSGKDCFKCECNDCEASTGPWKTLEELAITLWNTRALDPNAVTIPRGDWEKVISLLRKCEKDFQQEELSTHVEVTCENPSIALGRVELALEILNKHGEIK